jgi:transposase-like protein
VDNVVESLPGDAKDLRSLRDGQAQGFKTGGSDAASGVVETGAQAISLAESRAQAVVAFRAFRSRWCRAYPAMVRRLQQDLPDLLSFFAFPRHLWRKLRTTNVTERCFVEVRRRTRPMVCLVNVKSVDRIIYSIFQRFNMEWKTRTLNLFTQAA